MEEYKETRLTTPDRRKLRNLVQYRNLTDDEFEEIMLKQEMNVKPSQDFEKRIQLKLKSFGEDYDLTGLKVNDKETLRALIQAIISLEDYEQVLFRLRSGENSVSIDNLVLFDKISKIMTDLRSDISKLQDDLKITRKTRKGDKLESVTAYLDDLKARARKFTESRMSYIFCSKCRMLLSTMWFLYPLDPKNKIRLVCNRKTDNGEVCGNIESITSMELFEKGGSNHPEWLPEGIK